MAKQETTAPVNATEQAKEVAAAAGLKFKVTKNVTLPLIKPEIGQPVFFRVTAPVKIGKAVEKDKDAAIIADCVNLLTGEEAQILVPAVLQGILHDEYGAPRFGTVEKGAPVTELEPPIEDQVRDRYVGKSFQMIKHERATGKKYHSYSVAEIELED